MLQLERAFDKRSWHGTNLWGSLRDLTRTGTTSGSWRSTPPMGAAGHDLYHAGQIQLLKKLLASESSAETT